MRPGEVSVCLSVCLFSCFCLYMSLVSPLLCVCLGSLSLSLSLCLSVSLAFVCVCVCVCVQCKMAATGRGHDLVWPLVAMDQYLQVHARSCLVCGPVRRCQFWTRNLGKSMRTSATPLSRPYPTVWVLTV